MRRATLSLVVFAALALPACEKSSSRESETDKAPKPTWVHSEEALAAAARDGKPALLDITAAWCQPCVEYDKVTFVDEGVLDALRGWVLVRLDVTRQNDSHRVLQERYQALSLPAVILFDAAGQEVHRFETFVPPKPFIAELERLAIPAR